MFALFPFWAALVTVGPVAPESVSSFWVWAQGESARTFMASFSVHSVQGFSFWAEALTVQRINTEQSNRIRFMDGLLLGKLVYYGLTDNGLTDSAHLRRQNRSCRGSTTVII